MQRPDPIPPSGSGEMETVVDPPGAAPRSSPPSGRLSDFPSSGESTHATSVVTPRETLHLQEIARTRVVVVVVPFFGLVVALVLALVGGDPLAKRVFFSGLAVAVAACAWLGWHIRRDEGYTIGRAMVCAYACMFASFTGIWFFGVFSPAPAIIPFGLSFFSIGQSARGVFAVYFSCAVAQAVVTLLVVAGALPDQGLVQGAGLTRLEQIGILACVEGIFLATFLVQRKTRQATLYAIEQHDNVLRTLAQRDVLLREARQDFAQAMQIGGAGRWTDEVVGSFRLGRLIGRGAMGEVYEATRVGSEESAAVKLLHPHVLAQQDLVQRFVREAKIVATLAAANVVRVLEVAPTDARVPYIAMERLVGHDLADHLRDEKRMSPRHVLTLLRQVGLGLDAARASGVIHRDLKPRNLFLAREQSRHESWKILDFGVARLAGEETITHDHVVGTPNYMAPEQAAGGPLTHKVDLFALGVIAYRALTGRPAFDGDTTPQILYKVVHTMPPRPGDLVPVAPDIDLVLAIALAKDPDDRFDSAADLAQAFDAAARGRLDPALRARAERLLARLPWGPTEAP